MQNNIQKLILIEPIIPSFSQQEFILPTTRMKPKQLAKSISTPLLKLAALASLQMQEKKHKQLMKIKKETPNPLKNPA